MDTRRVSRVIVGVDDSIVGLRALRLAVAEARRRDAELHAVRVWTVVSRVAPAMAIPSCDLVEFAVETVNRSFAAAMGGQPTDVRVVVALVEGDPATALATYADGDDDLLVIGCPHRSLLRRLVGSTVLRSCLARASCPVLAVPPSVLARNERQMARAIRRDALALARGDRELPSP